MFCIALIDMPVVSGRAFDSSKIGAVTSSGVKKIRYFTLGWPEARKTDEYWTDLSYNEKSKQCVDECNRHDRNDLSRVCTVDKFGQLGHVLVYHEHVRQPFTADQLVLLHERSTVERIHLIGGILFSLERHTWCGLSLQALQKRI